MVQSPRTIGPYRLDAVLGRGGMGEVYKAYDERLDRYVAVKRVRPGADENGTRRARFRREARTAAQLVHPGIVQVFDILQTEDEADDSDWIIMELVHGRTMADLLDDGPLDVDEVLGYAIQLADALAAAHERGVVHRDLKVENVMITAKGHVKVLDFGIAKQLAPMDAGDAASSLTAQGQVVGTVRAMSPEQARGFELDHRSDLFSLGTLLYEALAGTSPFLGTTRMDTLTRVSTHRQTPVAELADIGARNPGAHAALSALSDLIDQLLEKAPELRPANAEEVHARLQRIADARRGLSDRTGSTSGVTGQATLDATTGAGAGALSVPAAQPAPARPGGARPVRARALIAISVLVAAGALVVVAGGQGARRDRARTVAPTQAVVADAGPPAGAPYEQGMALLRHFHRKGSVDRAIAIFQRMLAQDERSAPAHAGLARAYWTRYWSTDDSRDPMYLDQARDIAERAVSLDEFLADARISRGLVYLALGRVDEAERDFRAARELEPGNAEADYGAARVYQAQNRFEDAEAAYRRAIAHAPDDRRLYDDLGTLYFELGRYDDAERSFTRSVALAPDSIHGYRNLGSVYLVQGRHADAASQFQAALKIHPSASLYSNLGTVLFAQGLYTRAAAAFERALAMDGGANFHLHWGNLADAYRHSPDGQDKARAHYLRAIQLIDARLARSPDDHVLRSRRALYQAKRGQCEDARADIDVLASEAPEMAYTWYRMAVALEVCGHRERALAALEHALAKGLSPAEAQSDPELRALRADPAYHRMRMARAGQSPD